MNDSLRAAVLASAISVDPLPLDLSQLRVRPVRRVIDHIGAPLDLDAPYFRYRIDREGEVHVLPALPGARVCREKSSRGRARSSARS